MDFFKLFLKTFENRIFFSLRNLLCAFFIGTILINNLFLASHLPKQIQLLTIENPSAFFSPILFLLSMMALLALCGFCLSLRKPFDLIFLGMLSGFSLSLGIKSFSPSQNADAHFLEQHLKLFGHALPAQLYLFSLLILGIFLTIILFFPSQDSDFPASKISFSLPCLMLFLTIIAAQSYRFRHIELNQFISSKTGLIASFAGKDGALRFLYPRPYQDIAKWPCVKNATLQTEHAGERTALLLRREFPGIIGESFGFMLIQLSHPA